MVIHNKIRQRPLIPQTFPGTGCIFSHSREFRNFPMVSPCARPARRASRFTDSFLRFAIAYRPACDSINPLRQQSASAILAIPP